MKLHELKTVQPYFDMVWDGEKPYEIRKNDRDYEVGDLLWLREYNPDAVAIHDTENDCLVASSVYSTRSILVEVVAIIPAGELPYVDKEYCVMTIDVLQRGVGTVVV